MPEMRNVPRQPRPSPTSNANTPSTGTVFPNPLQAGNARTPSSDFAFGPRVAHLFGPEVAEQALAMRSQWAGHQPTQRQERVVGVVHTEEWQQDPIRQAVEAQSQEPVPTRAAVVAERQPGILGCLTLLPGSLDGSVEESRPKQRSRTRSGRQGVYERRPEKAKEDEKESDSDWLEDGEDELWKEARKSKR